MRKLIVLLMSVLVLSFGSAFAQQDPIIVTQEPGVVTGPVGEEPYWATFAIGYPLGVSFGFGVNDMISEDIDVRFMAGVSGGFGIAADAIFDLPVDLDGPLVVYAGGGPALTVGDPFLFGLRLFAGLEYRLVDLNFPQGGIYVEVGPQLNLIRGEGVPVGTLNARVGFNYYF